MKRFLLASTLAALTFAAPAFAGHGNGHGHGKGHDKGGHDAVIVAPGIRIGEPNPNGPEWKRAGRHDNGLHRGQHKRWARGQRLPTTYLVPRYYVRNYTTYDLAPPPPGMVWVRPYEDDRNFYLVQAATGLISQIFGR